MMLARISERIEPMQRLTIHRLPRPSTLLGVAMADLIAVTASAQTLNNSIQLDLQQNRANAGISTDRGSLVSRNFFVSQNAAQEGNLGFTFNGLAPVFYNSNAEMAHTNGTETAEGNPELRLGWSKQLPDLPLQ